MNFDLLIFLFFYISSIISILGYGLIFQKIINIPKNDFCLGYSGLIGIFFLTIISYTSNIILPHGLIHNSIIFIIGFFIFIYFFFKNYILKKDVKVFALIFLFLFLSFLVFKAHDDFPYYHFPYTYYLTENSSYLGIGNFNHGFRTPSSLFYFNSLFYLPVINYNLFHIGSLVYFGFSIYLLVNKILNGLKNNQIDYLYYYNLLALIFIIVFFYRLAEHGTDRSALILVFIIISEILRIFNKVKMSNYDVSIISVLYALIISLKAFYFLYIIMLIPLIFFIYSKLNIGNIFKMFSKNKSVYFSIFLLFLVLFNNFLNTGCLIYPLEISCYTSFEWSIQKNEINRMILHYENWSKAGMTPNFTVPNPEIYVKNFNWVSNWFETYFLFKVSDFILGIILLIFVAAVIFHSKQKKTCKWPKEIYLLYFIIIILILEWFLNHPALRYGGYSIIAISVILPFSFYLNKNKLNLKNLRKKTIIILLITISIFSYRNIDRLYKENKKYEYNVFKRPYYELNNVHFRVDKELDSLITNYINCLENNKNCNFSENYKVKKSFGKYIFVRKK